MTPVFTSRGSKQHRYYVTRLRPGENSKSAWRVPAGEIDRAVLECVAKLLTDRANNERDADDYAFPADPYRQSVPEQRELFLNENVQVRLGLEELVVVIGEQPELCVSIAARLARRGNELKLVIPTGAGTEQADPVLLKLIAHARAARETVMTGIPDPMVSHYSKRHLWQLLRLNWLAPDIITAIVEGRQPPSLTGRRLLRAVDVPLSWEAQRRYFQFS